MEFTSLLSITPIYVAILGLLFIPFTMRVGLYRLKTKIYIGTGDDPEMQRRMRAQANFTETVPIALFILIVMEFLGAGNLWLHSLGLILVLGRISHYLGLTEILPIMFRTAGMLATFITILSGSIWILLNSSLMSG